MLNLLQNPPARAATARLQPCRSGPKASNRLARVARPTRAWACEPAGSSRSGVVLDGDDNRVSMARFLIVDGHAYAYRAFYAIRQLRSPSGAPTNAIFGFIRMFGKMRAQVAPTHAMVVWDGGLSAERTAALPQYKAQRPEMPAELVPQLDQIIEYLQAAGVASFCREGVEADDYIACLVRRAVAVHWEVIIASSDKDFMQLVGPGVGLLNPHDKTETVWTVERVREKTGVSPEQIVDWLALVGDSSDNIPGVPGIGPKTAAELLRQFGSIEAIYARLEEVKPERLRAALAASAERVRRNVDLVRLKADLDCEFSPEALQLRSPDLKRLRELYTRWGFRSLLAELEASGRETLMWNAT